MEADCIVNDTSAHNPTRQDLLTSGFGRERELEVAKQHFHHVGYLSTLKEHAAFQKQITSWRAVQNEIGYHYQHRNLNVN